MTSHWDTNKKNMVTQKTIHELIEGCRETPEIAEAAYLAAKHLKTEEIDRNLRLRYGSGQGFAQFKEKVVESTEYDTLTSESSRYGAQVELHIEDESSRLDSITTDDLEIELDNVIRNAFEEEIVGQLQEEIEENLTFLSQNARAVAYLLRHGYDLGTWSDRTEPDADTVWQLYSIITGETPTDPIKEDLLEELVQEGCIYVNGQDIILNPGFANLEDPYAHLPTIDLTPPE
jgi:hypothetical protein